MKRVYFIKPIGMEGPIKIGRSMSPDNRRETLETWCPFPLEILAEIAGPNELERRFHARFVDLHIRHEWFRVNNELQAVIREVAEGTFDVDSLPQPAMLPRANRDNSAYSPAWRYRASVCGRLRHIKTHEASKFSMYLDRYLGSRDPFRWPLHQREIEQEIVRLRSAVQ